MMVSRSASVAEGTVLCVGSPAVKDENPVIRLFEDAWVSGLLLVIDLCFRPIPHDCVGGRALRHVKRIGTVCIYDDQRPCVVHDHSGIVVIITSVPRCHGHWTSPEGPEHVVMSHHSYIHVWTRKKAREVLLEFWS
jgi:hypothetical protein